MIYLSALLIILVQILCLFSRVPYSCRPYSPTDECEVGRYEIAFYEDTKLRNPIARAEVHCVKSISNKLKAETGRLIAYSTTPEEQEQNGPIRDVQYFEDQEFMKENAEVCLWQ